MHLFNSEDKLKKYDSVQEIIDDYFDVRLEYYDDRKEYLIDDFENNMIELSNKVKFIQEILDGTIDLRGMDEEQVVDTLILKDYDKMEGDEDFKYLTKMPMNTVTKKNVEKLKQEYNTAMNELERIKSTSIQEMWLTELNQLEEKYIEYKAERERLQYDSASTNDKKTKVKNVGKKKTTAKKA
jgi:DNA topoisomerase-2